MPFNCGWLPSARTASSILVLNFSKIGVRRLRPCFGEAEEDRQQQKQQLPMVASALTLIFGLLPIVNLAHGALYVLGVVCARSSMTFVLHHGAEL